MITQTGAFEEWLFSQEAFKELHGGDSDSDSDSDSDDGPTPRAPRSHRRTYTPEERYTSTFWKNYLSDEAMLKGIQRDNSKYSRKFRLRFRVPYSKFLEIVNDIRVTLNLIDNKRDCTGSEAVPISLLVLGSLRALSSGCSFDLIEELTNVSQETHRNFFHNKFCVWGYKVKDEHIRMPTTHGEIRHVSGLYERIGLPGCVGSADCVHVLWDKCPAGIANNCRGKEKHPTLAFQVISSHTKRILSVSQHFHGTVNDKTIALADASFRLFERDQLTGTVGSLFTQEWTSITSSTTGSTEIRKQKGCYLIVDGRGYHTWPYLICPFAEQPPNTPQEKWSSMVESARKDVECVFGILKNRFCILKYPIRIHDPLRIERIFVTCCVLHNLLLDYDGYDDWNWNEENIEVEYGVLEESAALKAKKKRKNRPRQAAGVRSNRRAEFGVDRADDNFFNQQSNNLKQQFHARRNILMNHFTRMTRCRRVRRGK